MGLVLWLGLPGLALLPGGCVGHAVKQTPAAADPAPDPAQAAGEQPVGSKGVLLGEIDLICELDDQGGGRQKLTVTNGGGLEFDAPASKRVADGPKGPPGGPRRFTLRLSRPAPGKLSGVGEVEIREMATTVSMAAGGADGAGLSFHADDMVRRGIAVEFAGLAVDRAGQRYRFHISLDAATGDTGSPGPPGPGELGKPPAAGAISAMAVVQRVR